MRQVALGRLGEFSNGVNFASDKMGRGVALVNVKDITGSHLIDIANLDLVDVQANGDLLAREDDIFFVRSSVKLDGIGLAAKLRHVDMPAIHCGFVIRFRPTSSEVVSDYLLYLLRSPEYRARLKNLSGGAAIVNISQSSLKQLEVPIPRSDTQERIASVLSAYDDLIENNRRRMKLLEGAARLLYQEWFVRLRFPGHERVRVKSGVPEGWEKKPLRELAEVVMGQSPESKYYNEDGDGLPFHQGVTDFGDRFVTNRIYTTATNRIANAGDILCSVRAPVGRLNLTLDKVVIGRGLAALRSRTGNQSFLYHQLRTHFFKEDMIGGGAIFASVTKAEFESQKLLTPPSRLTLDFEEVSVPADEQLRILFLQNQKLRAARDLLLPRLMSGETQLREAGHHARTGAGNHVGQPRDIDETRRS